VARESGEHLLHYRLIEKIGQGGMGSVWRARDTTLDRDAAIKILPDAFANDSQFLARFDREAKLLASLNHPNLAGVFGVHNVDSTRFLAMELVPGEDLSTRLERGPLSVRDTVEIMGRIADGLEAAHSKGIVHRDLKPANVRLTPDGLVKVLDFGLAKSVEGGTVDSSTGIDLTATGVVLGTAPYMSPEQARGRPVDARTDIWSFGCVLWECLTGARPFGGDTVPDLISEILNDEPDWSKLPAGTPPSIVRLLRRCLAKKLRQRLHHIADARIELEDADPESVVSTPHASQWPRIVLAIVLGVAVGALLFGFAGLTGRDNAPAPRAGVLANARFTKITHFPGEEFDADISPDGQFVAFMSDHRGEFEAYVGQIGAGEYEDMSSHVEIVGGMKYPPGRAVRRLGFRGDGEGIWLGGSPEARLRFISLIGKKTKYWLPKNTIHVDWANDGRVLYSSGRNGDPVSIADKNGVDPQEIDLPSEQGFHQHFPTWSPDGRWIYMVRGSMSFDEMDLWRVRPDGSGLEQLTGDRVRMVTYPVPIDDRTVLFIAREPDLSGPWLYEIDVETRDVRRATNGVEIYASLSGSRDGSRLVATVATPRVGLCTVPILSDRVATEDDVKEHPLATGRALAPRIHGDDMFYLSSIGGRDGLWRYRDGKPDEIWSGGDGAQLVHPCAVSPDGARIAIVVREDRRKRLYVINADGTEPRPLLQDIVIAGAACWSPDGEWLAVGGHSDGRKGLFKVRVRDGHMERIHSLEARHPVWSPDNRMIVFQGAQVGPWVHLLAVTPEGKQLEFPTIRVAALGERAQFLDAKRLIYLRGLDPEYEFRLLDLESGESRSLTKFKSSTTTRTFDITKDGKTIIFDRQRDNADIVLIERDVGK